MATTVADDSFTREPPLPTPPERATPTMVVIVPVPSPNDPLAGTRWQLVAFESDEPTPGIPDQPSIFLHFRNGGFGLETGCNDTNSNYLVEGERLTVTLSEQTQMLCADTLPGVNEVENAFFQATSSFHSYTMEDDTLRIQYDGGSVLFRRATEP